MRAEGSPPGCAKCLGAEAREAWASTNRAATRTFVRDVHFTVHATQCSCGQTFVCVFTERVDHRDGEDTQVELAVAVWPEEVDQLEAANDVGKTLTALVEGRRFLVKFTGEPPRWRPDGFSIGPHD